MDSPQVPTDVLDALQEMFGRSFQSAAGYILASEPYIVAADAGLLETLRLLEARSRIHALALNRLIDTLDAAARPSAFAYWKRDINYLSVPHGADFVRESLDDDLGRLDALLEIWPDPGVGGRALLTSIRDEKREQRDALAVQVKEALEREAAAYRDEAAAAREAREAIAARKKAEAEARKKAEREARAKAKEAAKAAKAAEADKEKPKPDAD